MTLIADGATFVTNPEGQIRLWSGKGPSCYSRMMSFFAEHTRLCRALAAAEIMVGTALLLRGGRQS
jgi:hypothetical protein